MAQRHINIVVPKSLQKEALTKIHTRSCTEACEDVHYEQGQSGGQAFHECSTCTCAKEFIPRSEPLMTSWATAQGIETSGTAHKGWVTTQGMENPGHGSTTRHTQHNYTEISVPYTRTAKHHYQSTKPWKISIKLYYYCEHKIFNT